MRFINFNKLAATILIVLFSLGSKQVQASHAQGADFSYQCLGGDSFKISLTFYRDCAGIAAPTTASINLSSASCAQNISITLNPETAPVEVSNQFLCPSQSGNSACNNGSQPGTTRTVFSARIKLPMACADWVVSYDLCCRNDLITNLTSPGSQDLYVSSTINNTNGNQYCNTSPVFGSLPIIYACANQPYNYSQGAVDVDGDSLSFTLINPLTGPGQNITYTGGYGINTPFGASSTFTFSTTTGQMNFTPAVNGAFVITILVREYRNGVLVGSTIRDIQVVVVSCTNSNPPVVTNIDSLTSGTQIDSITVEACPGQTINFRIVANDSPTDKLTLTTNVGTSIPGATLTVFGNGSSTIRANFSWTPTVLDTGINFFSVTISDSLSCPIRSVITKTFTIVVLDATDAGPDVVFCPAGGPVQLQAIGGTVFTWTPATGLNNPNIANPLASPTVTTDYIVTSNLSALCKNVDTVRVTVVNDFPFTISNDTAICRNGAVQLFVNPTSPLYAPYQYSWTPSNSLTNPILPNPVASPISTTDYIVSVRGNNGCIIKDTVKVTISGVGPLVVITPDKNNVCPGDTVRLTTGIYPLQCGPTINSCSAQNPPSFKTFGTGTATSNTGATPFQGTSQDARTQILYRASDLNAAGITSGTIVGIRLNIGTWTSIRAYDGFTIKMGCTSANGLAVATGFVPTSTVVFGPTSITTQSGNNQFNLTTPYDWDGVSNLVIEICYDNLSQSPGGNDQVIVTNTTYSSMMRNYGDNATGCSLLPQFVYSEIPNTTFFICNPLPRNYNYTWNPTAGLSDPNSLNPYVVLNQNTSYTLNVNDGQCVSSGIVNLRVDNSYSIDAYIDSNYACGDDSVQLHVKVLGTPPTNVLPCGANSTVCSTNPALHTVGTGNTLNSNTSYPAPFGNWYESVKQQYLYRANELTAAGIVSGTMTSIAFNVSSIPVGATTVYRNYTIKIGCTNLSALNPNSFASGLFTVFNPKTINITTGWNNLPLDNTFDWDGTSNIIIEICFNNDLGPLSTDYTDNAISPGTNMGYTASLFYRDDDLSACQATSPDGNSNSRPNTRFFVCVPPSVTTSIIWTPNNTLINPNTANPTAVPNGQTTYSVAYTFANGCIKRDSVTVTPLNFNGVVSNDTSVCIGASAVLAAFGGNKFTWSPQTGLSTVNTAIVTATPLQTTTYYVTIEDTLTGCRDIDTVTVTINPLPNILFAADSVLCFSDSITLDAGSGFVAYDWSPTQQTTQTITVTQTGNYYVTVSDVNGCSNNDSIELRLGTPPVVDIGPDQFGCAGDTIIFNAGSGFVSYLWNTASVDSAIVVTQSGIYSVLVFDADGCPARDTTEAIVLSPNLDLGNDTVLCAGATLTLVAGQSGPNYLWSTNATTPSILVTATDLYSVTVTVSGGTTCSVSDSIFVDIKEPVVIDLGPDTVTCNGSPIILDATNDYQGFLWSPGNQTTQTISVGVGGLYSVTVTDAFGCTGTDNIIVNDINPSVNAGNDTSVCMGNSVTLTVTGTGSLNYLWSPGNQTTTSITVNTANTYIVTGTDQNGCFDTDTVVVTVFANPTPNLGVDQTICSNETITLNPGTFTSYQWSDNSTDPTLTVDTAGIYSVIVTDGNGCSGTDNIIVSELPDIMVNLQDYTICSGDTITISAPSGYTYLWSNGATTQTISVSSSGEYFLQVTDGNGCSATALSNVNYYLYNVTASANPSTINKGDTTQLNAVVTGGSGNYTFVWTPAEGLNNPLIQNPTAAPQDTTIYTVTVVDSSNTCSAGSDTVEVVVIVESVYAVPDAFTPDGDGKNDLFQIYTAGNLSINEFKIYNRWGELVHNSTSGWDGVYKGEPQPVGTYVYYAVLQYPDGKKETINSAFTLIR
jgi:gliding motility-associated-like protein